MPEIDWIGGAAGAGAGAALYLLALRDTCRWAAYRLAGRPDEDLVGALAVTLSCLPAAALGPPRVALLLAAAVAFSWGLWLHGRWHATAGGTARRPAPGAGPGPAGPGD